MATKITREEYEKKFGIFPSSTRSPQAIPEATAKSKKDLLQKSTDFVNKIFPGRQVGESIGTLAGYGITAGKEKFGLAPKGSTSNYDLSGPKPKQVVADVATGVLDVAGMKGLGTAGKFGTRLAKGATLGAGLGATTEVAETGNIDGGTARSAAIGGAIGGAFPALTSGVSKTLNTLVVKTPKQFVNFALKTPAKQVPKELNEAFLKRKLGGKSLSSIYETTAKEVETLENQIQDSMRFERIASPEDVLNSIMVGAKKKGANVTTDTLRGRIQKFVPDYADLLNKASITDEEANILRKAIDNNLKEATFLGKELTNEQRLVKVFADRLRGMVQSSTKTETLFKQQSEAIGLRNLAEKALQKSETQGRPGLLDVASAGIGGSIGGIPGAAIGIAIERAIRSPQAQGGIAQALRALQPVQGILQNMSPATRAVFITSLQAILRGNAQDKSNQLPQR